MQVREIGKKLKKSLPQKEKEELLKRQKADSDKIITGMFEFLDAQGGWLEFTYRVYPGEPIQIIKLIHGEICDLPMGIVKHLNNTKKKIRRYSMEMSENGQRTPRSYETVSRVRFTPTNFL